MDIASRVKEIIGSHVDISINVNDIKDGDFLDILGVNSINFIRIVIELEMEYEIEFEIDKLGFEVFENIGDFIAYVKGLTENKEAGSSV